MHNLCVVIELFLESQMLLSFIHRSHCKFNPLGSIWMEVILDIPMKVISCASDSHHNQQLMSQKTLSAQQMSLL